MTTFQLLCLLATIAAVFGWISSRWLRLPNTIGTMLLTVVCALGLMSIGGYAPGIHLWATSLVRQVNFEQLILHGMLGLLLFAGAFFLDLKLLAREKVAVTVLSICGTLLSTILISVLMRWTLAAMSMPATWLECFFFGALISPTDPIAVLEMLRRVGVPKNVQAQLAGESLFNDGVGAVIFLALLDSSRGRMPGASHLLVMLLLKVGGGLSLGILAAGIVSLMMRSVRAYQVEILLTIALAAGGYALADAWQLSAPLEAVAAGIALRRFNMNHPREQIAHDSIDGFWEMIDEVQNAILFVLLGLEVLAVPIHWSSLRSGAAAVTIVTAVRFAVVALILVVLRLAKPGFSSSIMVLGWGGLRGGLSIALALAVPAQQGRAWILTATYIVVVFSIVVQGGFMDLFLHRFRTVAQQRV